MKNLLMIAIAFLTINATAQENNQKKAMTAKKEMQQSMTPEQTAELQTKKMTLHLDLTDKQQVQVQQILLDEAKQRDSKREAKQAQQAKVADAKVSQDEKLKMQNDRLDHQIEFKRKMKTVLDPEQYKKFEEMMGERQANKGQMKKMQD